MTPQLTDRDIQNLLTKRRQIAVIWSVEDMQALRPDLTGDECWAVLQAIAREYDADCGITWDSLAVTADKLCGETPPGDEA